MKKMQKLRTVRLGSVSRTTRAIVTIGAPEVANPLLQFNG